MNAEALIGTVLGTCTLQQLIGQGSMGAVYQAQQSRPRRHVAVKVFLPATVLPPQSLAIFLERFRRETDAVASLEHPNIMPVYEYGESKGLAYLVMSYVSGGTLGDVIEREGQLLLPRIISYLEQLAAALDFAHARGIIHRDIKPANILLTPEERLLLTDFGLVKIVTKEGQKQVRLTGAGEPVGTPEYMSPEQVTGDEVDGHADLYSLGIILYQMVTGTTPFQGETPMQIAAQQVQTPPSAPRLFRPDFPAAAEQVILKALSKRPFDRYSNGLELATAFRLALATSTSQTSTTLSDPCASSGIDDFSYKRMFDPKWQTGWLASTVNGQSASTGSVPVPNADGRSTGLLSRTGMFPKLGAESTGAVPSANFNQQKLEWVRIFFCYAHEDEALLNKLKKHLRPLQRLGHIKVWHDREIRAGTEWEHEICMQMNESQIILLLVSPDFIDSEFCFSVEMDQALKKHNRREADVIPIILRPSSWKETPISSLQALPTDGKPITTWRNRDKAFQNVVDGIHKIVKDHLAHRADLEQDTVQTIPTHRVSETAPSDVQGNGTSFPPILSESSDIV